MIFWNILQYCWWIQTVLPVKKMLNYVVYCLFCCLFRHRDRICDAFTDIEVWIGKNRTQVFGFHCALFKMYWNGKKCSKHFIHRPLVWEKVLLEQDYKSWKLKFPCILKLLKISPNFFSLLSLFFKNSLQVRSLHSVFNL